MTYYYIYKKIRITGREYRALKARRDYPDITCPPFTGYVGPRLTNRS